MRRLLVLVFSITPAAADTSIPSPPPAGGTWQSRCADSLKRAQDEAAKKDPGYTAATITVDKKQVRFELLLADSEHQRFYGKPAHYWVRVVEKKSKQPGELGADVGLATDGQASVGLSRWTRHRHAALDVQIAEGKKAHLFGRLFKPALAECLR